MGVTIHYRMGQYKKLVPKMLDDAQAFSENLLAAQAPALGIEYKVVREHPYRMHVEVGGCEWVCFGFGSMKHWEEKQQKEGWSYEVRTLNEERNFSRSVLADPDLMWASAFCKTQYATSIVEHKWVADIIRFVASRCRYTEVYDEGDYYHTGVLENAAEAIEENGKLIASMTGQLVQNFGAKNVMVGGITKIKGRKQKKEEQTNEIGSTDNGS